MDKPRTLVLSGDKYDLAISQVIDPGFFELLQRLSERAGVSPMEVLRAALVVYSAATGLKK